MDVDFDDEVNDFFDHEIAFNNETGVDEENTVPTDDQVLNDLFENENKLAGKSKKRVVLRPQPKLNEAVITGPKGIKALREAFRDFKPNIKKDPYSNLAIMMKKYEHWSHIMFPKMKFEDVVSRCEVLGDKRAVKVYMMKSRLDMPLEDEDFVSNNHSQDSELQRDDINSQFSNDSFDN